MDTSRLTTEVQGLRKPIDAAVGADGALYLAEYGSGFYNNTTSRISRITNADAASSTSAEAASSGPAAPPAAAIAAVVALVVMGTLRRRRVIV